MIKAIIFDLDGTLLNTLDGLKDSVNFALNKFNYPPKTLEEIRSFVGNGVAKLVERAIAEGKENPNFDMCLKIFKENYSQTMQNKTHPYSNIIELLKILKRKNIKTAVVSNKYDKAVKELCAQHFNGLIDIAIGENENCNPKPSTDGIDKAIKELSVKKDEILYIGDSEVDIFTAQNANIKIITVSWGFRDINYLKENGSNEIIDEPLELLNYLK